MEDLINVEFKKKLKLVRDDWRVTYIKNNVKSEFNVWRMLQLSTNKVSSWTEKLIPKGVTHETLHYDMSEVYSYFHCNL